MVSIALSRRRRYTSRLAIQSKNEQLTEANASLKKSVEWKDSNIAELVARVVEYENASLKARYELLKEYKEGRHID